jgi:hypothetical protein
MRSGRCRRFGCSLIPSARRRHRHRRALAARRPPALRAWHGTVRHDIGHIAPSLAQLTANIISACVSSRFTPPGMCPRARPPVRLVAPSQRGPNRANCTLNPKSSPPRRAEQPT